MKFDSTHNLNCEQHRLGILNTKVKIINYYMQFNNYKLPYISSACNLKTIKISLLLIWEETGTILRSEVVFRDTARKVEKPGQFRFSGTSGHPKYNSKYLPIQTPWTSTFFLAQPDNNEQFFIFINKNELMNFLGRADRQKSIKF